MKYTLKKIFENPFIYIKNNIIIEINDSLLKLSGYSKNELLGKSLSDLSSMLRIDSQVKLEYLENGQSCYLFTKKLEPREVIISSNRLNAENGKKYFIKEIPNSRIENRLPFAAGLLKDNEMGIAFYSITNKILVKVNNKFLDFLEKAHKKKEDYIGRNPEEIFKGLDEINLQWIFNETAEYNKHYFSMINKHQYIERGNKEWCVFLVPVYLSEKERYIVYTVYDITNKCKNNECSEIIEMDDAAIDVTEEFKETKQIEKTIKIHDELFANISHEFKTPLNVIYSTDQLLELYLKNDSLDENRDKICTSVNIIKQNCFRFAKLINNILDLHKIESGFYKLNLTNENIVQVIEDIVQSASKYIKRKGLNIIFDTNTEEKIIACDTGNIERIILNLISNAIKFSKPGGSIFVNVFDKGDTVEITVEDNGIGIEKQYLNKIFGTFQQVDKSLSRNAEGSGIGLSLVKSIVELHNGKVSVNSEVGKGSKFIIELPGRISENPSINEKTISAGSKTQKVMVEFSDIY